MPVARLRPATLILDDEGAQRHFPLDKDVITIGRSESCDIVVPRSTVSRLHARIELQHDRYLLVDAGSANGTFVNGKRIDQPIQLSTGDEIWLGSSDVALHFSDPEETLVMPQSFEPAPIFIDEDARTTMVYGAPVQLSPLEYGLLLHLAHNPGTVCTREGTFLAVWGQPYDHATCEDALNACIAKLRRNLRAAAEGAGREPPAITTVQRVGFRLDSEVAFAPNRERSQAER